ncbi:MAG: hypothetical protein ACRDO7_05180 [Nocardioidaceae bacterium]
MTVLPHLTVLPCALLTAALLTSCSSTPDAEVERARPSGDPGATMPWASDEAPRSTNGTAPDAAGGQSPIPGEPQASDAPSDEPTSDSEATTTPDATRAGAPLDPSRTRTAPNLPDGDEPVLDGRRMVALYGVPTTPSLGALGEQSLAESVERVRKLASSYDELTKDDVVPAFELIATVASTSAGDDGDFSSEMSLSVLRPWVERAAKDGVYVVLDLQPGRTDFLTQAKRYAPLLKYPHVGLALDPEWRLGPNQRHLEQIGSVHGNEVNETVDWLADLTERENLPQKLVVLHQFSTTMIDSRRLVDADRENVSVLIHADGQGTQAAKRGTWEALQRAAPRGVHWGWKNFIDEDHPMLTPEQTYRVAPRPDFVSYQ